MKKIISAILAGAITIGMFTSISHAETVLNLVDEDFENYTAGTDLASLNLSWATVSASNAGDSVTVADDGTGNKAVKITQTKGSSHQTGFYVNFPNIDEGIVEIKFSVMTDAKNAHLPSFFIHGASGSTGALYQYRSDVFYNRSLSTYLLSLSNTTYKEFKFVFNLDDNTGTINGNAIATRYLSLDLKQVQLTISDANKPDPGWLSTDENNPVYWIDNISVKRCGLSVEAQSIQNNQTGVEINQDITVDFNEPLDTTTLAGNVTLYKGNDPIDSNLYTVAAVDKRLTVSMPQGFDYNTKYKLVLSGNLKTTTPGYLPLSNAHEINFTTKRMFAVIANLTDGGEYSVVAPTLPTPSQGVNLVATLTKPDTTEVAYVSDTLIEEVGAYVLTLVGTDAGGKVQTDVYNFIVVGRQPPEAKDTRIIISGGADPADPAAITKLSVLEGKYTFYDINGDTEVKTSADPDAKITTYKWYQSDSANGTFTEIPGATGETYTPGETGKNKYYKFEVIPASNTEPYINTEKTFVSPAFAGYFDPVASDAIIGGTVLLGEDLTVNFNYHDENNQTRLDAGYNWYRSTDNGSTWNVVATTDTYTLQEADKDALIKVGVIPKKNTGDGAEEISDVISGLISPVAEDAKLNGKAQVGQTIYVSYVYSDKNKDAEGKTVIKWYQNNSLIAEGDSLQLTQAMAGKAIRAEVKPVSVNFPYEGVAISTSAVTVAGKAVQGGGGGSSSMMPIPQTKPAETPEEKPEEKPEENQETKPDDNTGTVFGDIETHWAKDAILEMYERGIINGVSENEFSPNTTVTRAQFAKMIVKIFGDLPKVLDANISDIDETKWYYEDVKKAAELGLMTGNGGLFRPEDDITREEICVVLMKALKVTESAENAEFADNEDISDWAKAAVNFAFQNGIVKGKDNNRFCPKDNATRAESIVMLQRLFGIMEVEDEK